MKLPKITKLGRRLIRFDGVSGDPFVVIRPENPELAIQLSKTVLETNDQELFQKIIMEQEYRYRGFLGRNGKVLDENGKYLELIKPGDSFVTLRNEGNN